LLINFILWNNQNLFLYILFALFLVPNFYMLYPSAIAKIKYQNSQDDKLFASKSFSYWQVYTFYKSYNLKRIDLDLTVKSRYFVEIVNFFGCFFVDLGWDIWFVNGGTNIFLDIFFCIFLILLINFILLICFKNLGKFNQ